MTAAVFAVASTDVAFLARKRRADLRRLRKQVGEMLRLTKKAKAPDSGGPGDWSDVAKRLVDRLLPEHAIYAVLLLVFAHVVLERVPAMMAAYSSAEGAAGAVPFFALILILVFGVLILRELRR